jgi:hypothetical protein
MTYPPEPWRLVGQMRVSVWAPPAGAVPPLPAALGPVRPVRIAGRLLVGAAWVDYQAGGDMAYHELLCAVLMRDGLRPRVGITHIWVDSAESRDGGRALWGIPKQLADFTMDDGSATATADRAEIAAGANRRGARLPGRWPVRFRIIQVLDGRPKTTPVRATARLGAGRVRWRFAPGGPLGFLAGRRPLVSMRLADFRMRFGATPPDQPPDRVPAAPDAVAGQPAGSRDAST